MEILVVIAITGMIAAVTAGVVKERKNEASYLLTLEIVTNIKKAIVGVDTPLVRGTAISGYMADMGSLPHFNRDGQPESLWRKTGGLPGSVYLPSSSTSKQIIWHPWEVMLLQAQMSKILNYIFRKMEKLTDRPTLNKEYEFMMQILNLKKNSIPDGCEILWQIFLLCLLLLFFFCGAALPGPD